LWLPASDFAESIIESRQYSSPEEFDISEIMAYNSTYSLTFNYSISPYHIDADDTGIGHDFILDLDKYWVAVAHFWYWWIIPTGHHEMEWYDVDHSEKISRQDGPFEKLDIETLDDYSLGSIFYLECEHLQLMGN